MSDNTLSKERILSAAAGAVKNLVRNNHVARLDGFFHDAHGADGHDVGDAKLFQGVNVGAVVDLSWREAVTAAVSREKIDRASGYFRLKNRV